jgi:predicted Zn-dependent protease with MMP-like domain
MKMNDDDFDSAVRLAIENIPEEIRQHLDNLVITVQKRPSRQMLRDLGIEQPKKLLGLFHGVPLTEHTVTSPPLFPHTIYLFQEALEEMCRTKEELVDQIEITVVHEVAHYVGMSEARLVELGYG